MSTYPEPTAIVTCAIGVFKWQALVLLNLDVVCVGRLRIRGGVDNVVEAC